MLEEIWVELTDMKSDRVLDVACKDGQVTSEFLASRFKAIDMFDNDPVEIKKAKKLKSKYKNIKRIDCASMQNYEWREKYNCVFMRWSIAYLQDYEVPEFLRKAK